MTTETAPRRRIVWLDAAKGFAIALVVFGHVLGGVLARDWLATKGPWRGVYDFIYLFHMPVFFMVSGLLLHDAAHSKPIQAIVSRLGSILWPYLLWDVTIRWVLLPFIGRFMGSAPGEFSAAEWLMKALLGELSWFFWTLFLVQVIYIALNRLPTWPLLIASFAIAAAFPETGLGPLQYLIDFMPFLLVGVAVRPFMEHLEIEGRAWQLATAIALFAAMAAAVAVGWTQWRPLRLVCNVAGIFATIALVQCMGRRLQTGLLSQLGMASLAIYVIHPYFQGTARGLLSAVAGNEPFLHLAVQTIFAVAGPYIVWRIVERLGAASVFRLDLVGRASK